MFDNLINQNRLTTAEKAEKADYYKAVLESERISREQADRDIIGLLHNVKSRYDCKLNTYMAKKQQQSGDNKKPNHQDSNNKKGSKQQNKPRQEKILGWGATDTQQKDSNEVDEWDVATTTTNNGAKDDNWGTTNGANWDDNGTSNQAQDDGWDNVASNNDQNQTDDWGNNADQTNHQPSNDWDNIGGDTAKKDTWGNDDGKDIDAGWGDSSTNDTNKNTPEQKLNQKDQQGSNKKNKNKQQQQNSASKQGKNQDKDKNQEGDQNKNNANDGSKDAANGSNNHKLANKTPSPTKPTIETNTNKDSQALDKSAIIQSKDFLDMKSQLWTAKLDLRLLERDKSKLLDEVNSLRSERDELIQKMAQTNQEQDSMKVKVRGLTVDLLAANEEIHKLNDCIDQLETERRNRERDVNMSETKRRSMEGKYRSYQQQIADLQSELSLTKEEKDAYASSNLDLTKRTERLENDLSHSKSLIRTLKDGCALVENQARTFEIRHDTVIMSKADLERELIAIKEESSRHITTINQLQKSNEKISKAFIQSVEAHEACKLEVEKLHSEFSRKLQVYEVENLRLVEANKQLRKVIDHLQKKR